MEIVLNCIFHQDISRYIINLAKQFYKEDREMLYHLIYSDSLISKNRIYNYNNLFKFNCTIEVNSLINQINILKKCNQLDYNTIEKIMCYLAYCEHVAYQDYMYDEHDYYFNNNTMIDIKHIYNAIGVDVSVFPDYIREHQLSIVKGFKSPFYI
tara:strand:- start:713 stop:1174 length:462 start_codon:yes stop_codon:yes gene_type:complete